MNTSSMQQHMGHLLDVRRYISHFFSTIDFSSTVLYDSNFSLGMVTCCVAYCSGAHESYFPCSPSTFSGTRKQSMGILRLFHGSNQVLIKWVGSLVGSTPLLTVIRMIPSKSGI